MSAIKAGDLVMVVKWPCCAGLLGKIRTVIESPRDHSARPIQKCRICGHSIKSPPMRAKISSPTSPGWVPVSWLIKIDPPAQPESVERSEEVTA